MAIPCHIFPATQSIWSDHDNCSSLIKPSNLIFLTFSMWIPHLNRFKQESLAILHLVPIAMHSVLVMFKTKLLLTSCCSMCLGVPGF